MLEFPAAQPSTLSSTLLSSCICIHPIDDLTHSYSFKYYPYADDRYIMYQNKASFHRPDSYIYLQLDIQQTSQFNMSKTKLLITLKTFSKLTFPIPLHCYSFRPTVKSKRIFLTHLISSLSGSHISSKYKINPVSHHISYLDCYNPDAATITSFQNSCHSLKKKSLPVYPHPSTS